MIILFCVLANAKIPEMDFIQLQAGDDTRDVCKFLNAQVFIKSEKQIDDRTLEIQREFSTAKGNFKIKCHQLRRLGGLYPFFEEAVIFFDQSISSNDTKISYDPQNSQILSAELTNLAEVDTIYTYGLHYVPYATYEKIDGVPRFQITCVHHEQISVASSCKATAVKN